MISNGNTSTYTIYAYIYVYKYPCFELVWLETLQLLMIIECEIDYNYLKLTRCFECVAIRKLYQ